MSLGCLVGIFTKLSQKGEDFFRGNGVQVTLAKLFIKFCEKYLIINYCVFFWSFGCGDRDNTRRTL